jgi:F0F1-type ATP synthase membrane subunit c/vacuolar-type H+-ATPase subunit K
MNQQRIIWLAIVFSTFVYVFLAYTFGPNPSATFTEAVSDTMTLAMYAAAFATFMAALVMPGMLVQSPPRLKMIIALALFEACTIFGLVAAVLHHDWRLIVPPWIASLVGFMREWPSSEVQSPVM